MLPAAAVMFALVAQLAWCWLPRGRVQLNPERLDGHAVDRRLAAGSMLALLAMVVAMEYCHAVTGALGLLLLFALVALLTWFWLPQERIRLSPERIDGHAVDRRLAVGSMLALLAMVVAMEYGHAVAGALGLLALFALLARAALWRMDWLLLATFAAIFLGLGHVAQLPLVSHALDRLDFGQPLTVYLGGIVAAQLISNVPATVLLLDRSPDAIALAVAVNVGGFGVAIGSLANLIALRLARQPRALRLLHLVSIPFLLVCAPLVYVVWRWLG
jgi:Na+/H+ antiporter NhaD/arsenite permease-like protein